jgi:putative transcriptional regulator
MDHAARSGPKHTGHPTRMTVVNDLKNLEGQCLIAMPDMPDSRFQGSVIYICTQGPDGAMGLIINKPADDVRLKDLMQQLSIETNAAFIDRKVYFGGPVEHSRGFILHDSDYHSDLSSIAVTQDVSMTATTDILDDIALGKGPKLSLVTLGYAGWGPGQLEKEISANGWLVAELGTDIIFKLPSFEKWSAALGVLGISPALLSGGGSA